MEWQFSEQPSCEDCHVLYDGVPPCESCDFVEIESGVNPAFEAVQIWRDLNIFSRPSSMAGFMLIPFSEIRQAASNNLDLIEQIKIIEITAYPLIIKDKKD